MRLFLASSFAACASIFFDRLSAPTSAVSIRNASDPWEGQPMPWIDEDEAAFKASGTTVVPLDLRDASPRLARSVFAEHDVLYVGGGSALYLMRLLRKRRLLRPLREAILAQPSVAYVGSSAGTMITSRDLSLAQWDCDEIEAGRITPETDYRGLGLVPFYFLCHANDAEYTESNQETIAHLASYPFPVLSLRDGQALWCAHDRFEVVGT